LKICCYNLDSALVAADAGADRVELCADPGAGGTTPGIGLIKAVRKKNRHLNCIPLYGSAAGIFYFRKKSST